MTDYTDTPPKELLKPVGDRSVSQTPTPENTAFYAVDEDGETYFYCGRLAS